MTDRAGIRRRSGKAVVDGVRSYCLYLETVNGAFLDIPECLLDDLPAAFSCMVDIAEKVQCAHRRILEYEDRIYKGVVVEGWRTVAIEYQFAVFECTSTEEFSV